MVRIPSLGSGKNLSLWLRKNSPYEVLMISLARFNPMETTQKKQSAQGICFYLRRKMQIAPRTCTGKITHGPQSPSWYFTPQRFSSWGQGQPCLPELPLVEAIHATDSLEHTQMIWLSLLKPSWGRSTLLLWFYTSNGLSASFHLFFLMTCADMLATVSADISQLFLPSVYLSVSDTKCGFRVLELRGV